jgi:hypothetical protein
MAVDGVIASLGVIAVEDAMTDVETEVVAAATEGAAAATAER